MFVGTIEKTAIRFTARPCDTNDFLIDLFNEISRKYKQCFFLCAIQKNAVCKRRNASLAEFQGNVLLHFIFNSNVNVRNSGA